jgi:hypothetical protein
MVTIMRRERAASLLAATPLFSGLSQPELLRLAEATAERVYRRGQFLFHLATGYSSLPTAWSRWWSPRPTARR